jgi:hypothetical protein
MYYTQISTLNRAGPLEMARGSKGVTQEDEFVSAALRVCAMIGDAGIIDN